VFVGLGKERAAIKMERYNDPGEVVLVDSDDADIKKPA
jgi:hypothetical protein